VSAETSGKRNTQNHSHRPKIFNSRFAAAD